MNYSIWFSTIRNITPAKKISILNFFKTFENVFKAKENEYLKIKDIDLKDINEIFISKSNQNIKKVENIEIYMKKYNIGLLNIFDSKYPKLLKKIYDPPCMLFYKGNINLINEDNIGVVGSRSASNYGKRMAYNIGKELAYNKLTVVSGLARGVDTFSHKGAIDFYGNTIAVIGNGLDYVYPCENYALYKQISEKGLIISEFPIGTKPIANNFPARNRIISGISKAIIVVEATQNSGALITAEFAIEQGRAVYALPGNIDSLNSEGCNKLIKDGAMIYTCIEDLYI